MLNLRYIALGAAVVVMAGCGQDPSGPATSPDLQSVVRTAGAKTPAGITIELEAPDPAAEGVLQPFETFGRKVTDFALVANDRTGTSPSSMTFTHLGAGDYSFQAEPVEGFFISGIFCTTTDGTTVDEPGLQTVTIHLLKKGSARCLFILASSPI